ncbi:MAG TPA: polysaccharide biosynthesis tyrosine autokinase [Candidatus Cryptobacteroides merdipullorum]|uniref:non-specific protein-tyrosine kinase n=1 Tax=Candidatus Cryptobacteroides merdipullorum TaxID=2840771 RepID=A0A9D1KHF1_9BACT|nr:polysaccharide biosynthesis tyrosine autokinase [Candidatus Cryptobacteroides merdipullorum]
MGIKDFFYLCLAKWRWFALSLVVVLGAALLYLLTTPPVYTRSTSLLLKFEQGPRSSITDAAGVLGDLNLFQSYTNVNNEILSLQSPALMTEVVKRLGLNVNYSTDGTFHKEVLYGLARPYEVEFEGFADNAGVSFTITPEDDGTLTLDHFRLDGDKYRGEVTAYVDSLTATPVGTLIVRQLVPSDTTVLGRPVYVSRSGYAFAGKAYAKRLVVGQSDDESTVIDLSIDDVSPQRAEDLLNTVIAIYNENWIKDKNQVAVSNSMFIEDRLAVIEQQLGNVDEDISAYKSEHLLPDVQSAATMYMTQSSEADAQLLELNIQLSMARYILNYMMSGSGANQLLPTNSGIESSGIERQISEYNALQLQRNNLVANSSVTNPLVVDMDNSLEAMRGAIVTSINNHIATLGTQIEAIENSAMQTSQRIAAAPGQGQYLLSVERQQKVMESLYLFLLQKREENELSQAFTAYNTRIINPPSGDPVPTSPSRNKVLMIAFVLGLLIPMGVIMLREMLNTRIRGRKDLEQLTVPFAGEIPLVGEGKKNHLLPDFLRKADVDGGVREIVVRHASRNMINEAFRVLRTNMEFMLASSRGKAEICVFTSFNVGSGKTFISINAAACFALKGRKVLAIDCDLRKASLSAYAGSPSRGLSDYLAGRADDISRLIVSVEGHKGLDILPVGTMPPNPAELLSDPAFAELMESLRAKYDYIFVDCPPIDIVADTQVVEKIADRTFFVVRAGLLEREMLPVLQKAYEEQRLKSMSVILNGTESAGSSYGWYSYGYGYGSGKDAYYSSKE